MTMIMMRKKIADGADVDYDVDVDDDVDDTGGSRERKQCGFLPRGLIPLLLQL